MSFDGKSYLVVAKELIEYSEEHPNKESFIRASVSRSYYALFLVARKTMENRGQTVPSSGQAHRHVQQYYNRSGASKIDKKIAKALGDLRDERNYADYDTEEVFDKNRALLAYTKAVQNCSRLTS
jgi:uncharacterized protein (UPF0332 family)